jgi:hypothetical protein
MENGQLATLFEVHFRLRPVKSRSSTKRSAEVEAAPKAVMVIVPYLERSSNLLALAPARQSISLPRLTRTGVPTRFLLRRSMWPVRERA